MIVNIQEIGKYNSDINNLSKNSLRYYKYKMKNIL